jgi:transcriptional regulator with XRE-family HTH domain
MSIGQILKENRKAANLTQKQLAEKSKISFVSINRIEGGSSPRLSIISQLFGAMNKKIDYVITDNEVSTIF